jgi:hypothetical protein
VWGRHEFFDLYINQITLPSEYEDWNEPAQLMTVREALDASECIRLAFRDCARTSGIRPQDLASRLLELLGPLEPEQAAAVEDTVFGMGDMTPDETPLIHKTLAATGELSALAA